MPQSRLQAAALSGGVFQNRAILEWLSEDLTRQGFEALVNRQAPANDGGIALGQAWAARQSRL